MNDNLPQENTVLVIPYRTAWVRSNHGVFAQLSRKLRVSRQFVRAVFYGHRRSKRVEQALHAVRAPGFERTERE
jgi:hypothetical protein